MICKECQPRLSDFIDGHLSPGESLRINEHLSSCITCNVVHQDLNLIVVASRELPLHSPSPMWERIQAEIGHEISGNTHRGRWSRLWSKRFQITLSIPQLALAISLIIAVAVMSSIVTRMGLSHNAQVETAAVQSPSPVIPDDVKKSIEDYSGRIQERMPNWDPQMRSNFEQNMAVINLSMDKVQRELAINPDDDVSRDLLRSAYDKKLKLLEDFSEF